MKRVSVLILLFLVSFSLDVFAYEVSFDNAIISSSIDTQVNRINYEIRRNKREIARIQASRDLSYNEKKRKIRQLEYEIYRQKRAIHRIQA